MNYILLLVVSLLSVSCSSFITDAYKSEKITSISGIDFKISKHKILSYETNEGTYGYFYGNTKPEDVKSIFEKALSWNEQSKSKNIDFIKEIDSYIMGALTFSYNHKAKAEDSFVTVCFQNAKYTHITDIKCGLATMKQIPVVINSLSSENVDKVLTLLDEQKNAAAELQ